MKKPDPKTAGTAMAILFGPARMSKVGKPVNPARPSNHELVRLANHRVDSAQAKREAKALKRLKAGAL
jgi:hypothetical protein